MGTDHAAQRARRPGHGVRRERPVALPDGEMPGETERQRSRRRADRTRSCSTPARRVVGAGAS